MKFMMCKKWFLFPGAFMFVLPTMALADAPGGHGHSKGHFNVETNIDIEYFGIGDAKSKTANTQVGASGMRIEMESENEKSNMNYSLALERWNYSWTNPENLPFFSGASGVPWSTFNTIQLGIGYEQEFSEKWEFGYYLEAESSYEKEMSGSNEYELGVDFNYEHSDAWSYTINVNLEYLDASSAELGLDLEIEWNHDKKDGWSGEFEISSEFPETSLTYHYTRNFSTSMFYGEGGTNTIRLSDSNPVPGMQAGYLEDEYMTLGVRVDYEFAYDSYWAFILQQNSNRTLSFSNSNGVEGPSYALGNSTEVAVKFTYTF